MLSNLPMTLWWLAENSLVLCFTLDFLLGVTQTGGRRCLPIWLAVNGAATLTVIFFQPPAAFLFSILFLGALARGVLKIRGSDLIVPMTVISTLYTLKESFSALILSWLSVSVQSPTGGAAEQVLIPLLLDALLVAVLRAIRARYPHKLTQSVSPYLYALLPACVFAVLALRWGLRLDSLEFEPYLATFSVQVRLFALFSLIGAAAVISTAFRAFCRLNCFLERERLLQNQLDAANGRNRAYASFQHDIHNHLLVVSGLLREKSFTQAERYADQLKTGSEQLLGNVSTGNPALDVLLGEKLGDAKRGHITVSCDVRIPDGFNVSDRDLCALFANILDNAITACLKEAEGSRYLRLSAKVRSQFLVVEAVNTAGAGGTVLFGTGLNNIRRIAERYQGAMETELAGGRFRISVLLCSR